MRRWWASIAAVATPNSPILGAPWWWIRTASSSPMPQIGKASSPPPATPPWPSTGAPSSQPSETPDCWNELGQQTVGWKSAKAYTPTVLCWSSIFGLPSHDPHAPHPKARPTCVALDPHSAGDSPPPPPATEPVAPRPVVQAAGLPPVDPHSNLRPGLLGHTGLRRFSRFHKGLSTLRFQWFCKLRHQSESFLS